MEHSYWNYWYADWGWFLWIGIWFLMISTFGNWGYTYKVHRRYDDMTRKTAIDILNERYARGEIVREEFHKMKSDIIQINYDIVTESQQNRTNTNKIKL